MTIRVEFLGGPMDGRLQYLPECPPFLDVRVPVLGEVSARPLSAEAVAEPVPVEVQVYRLRRSRWQPDDGGPVLYYAHPVYD